MKKISRHLGFALILGASTLSQIAKSEEGMGKERMGKERMGQGDGSKMAEHLAERKAHILKNMDERIAKMTAAKSCVQGAATFEALKSCRPKGGHKGEHGGGGGGDEGRDEGPGED